MPLQAGRVDPEQSRALIRAALERRQAQQAPTHGVGLMDPEMGRQAVREALQKRLAPQAPTAPQEKPGPLQAFAGNFLEQGGNVLRAIDIGIERLGGTAKPQLQEDIGAVRGAAQQVYPQEIRGTGSFWGEKIPGALGSTAPTMLATAAFGPAAGTMVAGAGMGAPVYDEILQETGDTGKATKGALGVAALAPLEVATGAGGALLGLGKQLAKRGILEVGKTILKTVGSEVSQEVVEQVVTDGLLESLTGKDKEILQNALDTIGPSAVIATLFGGARGIAEHTRAGSETRSQAVPGRSEEIQMPADRQPVQATLQGLKPDVSAQGEHIAATSPPQTGRPVDVEREAREVQEELGGLSREIEEATLAPDLKRRADIDAGTGLLRKEKGPERANDVRREARREGKKAVLLFADYDNFKSVNKQFGLSGGDKALAVASEAMSKALREGDLVRWGGDEFTAPIKVADEAAAEIVRAKLEKVGNDAIQAAGFGMADGKPIGISIGSEEILDTDDLSSVEGMKALVDRANERMKDQKGKRGVSQAREPDKALQPEEMTSEQMAPDKAPTEKDTPDTSLREMVRSLGGLRFAEDISDLTRLDAGETQIVERKGKKSGQTYGQRQPTRRRPIVNDQKSGKGMSIDDAAEAAWELGFFTERPTVAEFIDALHGDRKHPAAPQPKRTEADLAQDAARGEAQFQAATSRDVDDGPPKATSIKNAVVDSELEKMGLRPALRGESVKFRERHARAMDALKEDPFAGQKLVKALEADPRPPTGDEGALLGLEVNRLINERDAAQDAFNDDPSEANRKLVDEAQAAYGRAADVTAQAGTESSASLSIRKMMVARDYSLAQMERELQVARRGGEVSAEERAELAKIETELETATARADAAELRVAALEAERALAKLKKKAAKLPAEKPPKRRRSAIEKTKKEIEEIYLRMGERSKNRVHSGSGFGPDDVPDLVLLAGKHIKLGVQTFDAWAAEVVSRLGEGVRPLLRGAWNEAEKKKGESRLKAQRTRIENEIKETERRIAEQDFTEKERRPLQADPETVRRKAELEGIKRRFHGMRRRAERESRTFAEKAKAALREVAAAPKEVTPNYDFGAVFTQGAILAPGQPIKTVRHMARMFNAFATEQRALREMERLKRHPLYPLARQAKLPMMEWDTDLADGEAYIGSWVSKKLPFIKNFNRAFSTFLNVQRHEKFYEMVRSDWSEKRPPTAKELTRLAQNIGVLTGRGSLGKANAAMDAMNNIFFSPRKMVGNIQAVIGTPLMYGGYRHKKAFAKQYARSMLGYAAMVQLAAMAAKAYGVDFEWGDDETSPNAGKIKFGDKWYDPLGGASQAITFVWRLIEGKKTSATGKVTQLRGPKASYKGYAGVVADYGRSKLGPTPGFVADVWTGKDWNDKPITPLESAKEHFIPMVPHDFFKALKAEGFSDAAAETLVNLPGIRSRDYARTSR